MKLLGIAATLRRFCDDSITLARPGAASYDANGVATVAGGTSSTVLAHVERPARGGDLQHLPEGDRTSRTCSVWCSTELRHRDLITLEDGEQYELQAVEPWDKVAGFWRAVGLKVQS